MREQREAPRITAIDPVRDDEIARLRRRRRSGIASRRERAHDCEREGDQSLYYGVRSPSNTSLYSNLAIVRVGQTLIELEWERDAGFADFNQLGKFAGKLVTRLKDALAGKVKPSPTPATDKDLLPAEHFVDSAYVGTVSDLQTRGRLWVDLDP